MHSNFEKAFDASKRKDYMNARNLYHDLLLDIHTYSDYYLLKELIYLLDLKLAQKNEIADLKDIITGYSIIEDQNEMKNYQSKKDLSAYSLLIPLGKGLFKNSYIGINEKENTISMYCYVDKYNFVIKDLSLDCYYIFNLKEQLYSYESGCIIHSICDKKMKEHTNKYITLFNDLLFYYHLKKPVELIDPDRIHDFYLKADNALNIDLSRFEYIDFQDFQFDDDDIKEITHYLKLMGPLTWLSDQNGIKIPVENLQYDLLGQKWCNHRLFLEWLTLLKLMPYIQFGKSVFIYKNSYYLPYEQSYYIERAITRLDDDRGIEA